MDSETTRCEPSCSAPVGLRLGRCSQAATAAKCTESERRATSRALNPLRKRLNNETCTRTACRFNWALNEPLTPEREALFVGGVDGVSYPGVFSCRYTHVNEDGGEGSVWWLRFYEALVLRCCTYFQSSVK